MSRAKIAFVHSAAFYHLACLADPAVKSYDVVDVHAMDLGAAGERGDAARAALADCDAVYVAARIHPKAMAAAAPALVGALQRPGLRMAIDGENAVGSWLPGTTEELRGINFWWWRTGEDVGLRTLNKEHPLWTDCLSEPAVRWHTHGVLAPPAGATPLAMLVPIGEDRTDPWAGTYTAIEGHPNIVLYHDEVTFPAEVLVSTMDAAYHHGQGFMPGATQLFYRKLRWISQAAGR